MKEYLLDFDMDIDIVIMIKKTKANYLQLAKDRSSFFLRNSFIFLVCQSREIELKFSLAASTERFNQLKYFNLSFKKQSLYFRIKRV